MIFYVVLMLSDSLNIRPGQSDCTSAAYVDLDSAEDMPL